MEFNKIVWVGLGIMFLGVILGVLGIDSKIILLGTQVFGFLVAGIGLYLTDF